jgi:hypothetical protein
MIRSQSYQAVILTVKDEVRTLTPHSLFNHLYLVMVAARASDETTIRLYVRFLKSEDGFESLARSNVDSDHTIRFGDLHTEC